ncbi:DEAD/DEAH box helicase [Herpetosiphon llansteffanensis]|uniref:DEAD/DEAH box helicase n=1 Tax=Herpetosiphon llansteffanensis TaxID=2094568 RepID=UPI000D7CAC07|nr:SNF2-related protein [Herpetosiphon llansteffanensis]
MEELRRQRYLEILASLPEPAFELAQLVQALPEIDQPEIEADLLHLGFELDEYLIRADFEAALTPNTRATRPQIPVAAPPRLQALPPILNELRFRPPTDGERARLLSGHVTPADRWAVREQAEHYTLKGGFDHLLSLEYAAIDAKEYQLRAVRRVLGEMHGNAILADEVGLGKTIEAGLIIKEYHLREMIRTCLILTPAPLSEQWLEEMHDKFGMNFHRLGDDTDIGQYPLVVGSIDRAKGAYRKALTDRTWDMLVIDECHMLKNHRTGRYKFVFNLNRKHCLLLSATPVQNELRELYNLITVARPGHLKGPRQFQKLFMEDRRHARNVDHLRALLNEVMIRNRRSNTLTELPPRLIHHHEIELTDDEHDFHDAMVRFCKHIYQRYVEGEIVLQSIDGKVVVSKLVLVLMTLLKEMTSSPRAVGHTLRGAMTARLGKMDGADSSELDRLLKIVDEMQIPSKARTLLKIVKNDDSKIIVYTEFVATLEFLRDFLADHGVESVLFHGGLSGMQKRSAVERFRDGKAQVFLSTESGGQGLNLQFCHRLVNYDLPWNPMRIEQRIGRVHRYGQERPVEIYTLILRGTIEEYILHVLTGKIDMFQTVIGEIDAMLSFMHEQQSLEVRITDIILHSKSFDEIRAQMELLGEELRKANDTLNEAEKTNAALLDSVLG